MTMNVSPAIQKSYVFREFRPEMDPALRLTPCPKWELSKKKVGTWILAGKEEGFVFPCVVGMIPSIIPLLKNKINLITYLHNRQ